MLILKRPISAARYKSADTRWIIMMETQVPERALEALAALKAKDYLSKLVARGDSDEVSLKDMVFPVHQGRTMFFDASGPTQGVQPDQLLEKANEKIMQCEPYSSMILNSIGNDEGVELKSLELDSLDFENMESGKLNLDPTWFDRLKADPQQQNSLMRSSL